jgi:3-methyl-2-oxobutanoate hydroxymethyltransferase
VIQTARSSVQDLAARARQGQRIVMVTAYEASGARLAEEAGMDILLVGDSAATTMLGYQSTVQVTMEDLLVLAGAVCRSVTRTLVVADMPFGSYQPSNEDAVRNAVRFVRDAGADIVKLEGAGTSLDRVKAIAAAGIPVMGHVGLTPQSASLLDDFTVRGRSDVEAGEIFEGALALERAGCCAVVLEAIPAPLAARITEALTIPTIGIGAGPSCDGQVLVWHDLLGLTQGHIPKFVKQFAHESETILEALRAYAREVRDGTFPAAAQSYGMKK